MPITLDGTLGITTPSLTTGSFTNTGAESIGGNLTFTSTGARILADMSNATLANRLFFQTSTTNSQTALGIIPNGSSTTAQLQVYNSQDTLNFSRFALQATNASVTLLSDYAGTGSYLPMVFNIGGSERMRIDTSGNVGINYTNMAALGAKLYVYGYSGFGASANGSISLGSRLYWSSTFENFAGGYGLGVNVSAATGIVQIQSQRFDGTATAYDIALNPLGGNVGIGTASPASNTRLYVSGGRTVLAANSETYSLCLQYTTAGVGQYYIGASNSTTPDLVFSNVGGTERMRLTTTGILSLNGAPPATDYPLNIIYNATVGNAGLVIFSSGSTVSVTLQSATTGGYLTVREAYPLVFQTSNTERMRIDSTGKVGIGASTLYQTLTVNGGIGFAGTGLNSSDKKLYSPADGGLDWYTNSAAGVHYFSVSNQGTQVVLLNTSGSSYLNGGFLGIGISAPNTQVQVDSTVSMGTGTAVADVLSLTDNNGTLSGTTGDKIGMIISAQTNVSDRKIGLYNIAGNTNFNNPDFAIWQTGQGIAFRETFRVTADTPANLKFNSGYGSVATAYGCRVWLNYDSNAQSILGSGGVSSVTYNSAGLWTINFSVTMPDSNYAVVCGSTSYAATDINRYVMVRGTSGTPALKSTTQVQMVQGYSNVPSNDTHPMYVAIFR